MASVEEPRPSFEERLERLTELVESLERGDLSLEAAIDGFERGKHLHQELLAELAAYEKRLEKLVVRPDGTDGLVPLEERGGGEE